MEQMSLENYKKKVEDKLILLVGMESSQKIMKDYESHLQEYLEENWEPEVLAGGMVNYLV